tara:strand:- start:3378 stop:3578 length:201 start_codon:yes stop_codon:yes gene_type:complete
MVNRSLKRHNSTKKMTMKNRSTKKGGIKKRSGKRMSGKRMSGKKSLRGGYTYGTSRSKGSRRRTRR